MDIIQKNVYVDLTFSPLLAAKIFLELPKVSLLAGYTSLDSLCSTYVFGHKREREGRRWKHILSLLHPSYTLSTTVLGSGLWALVPFYSYNASYFLDPFFQRPFLRGLFLEGPIFGGAYLRSEICVSKSIWLALYLEGNLPFLLCFFFLPFLLCFVFEGNFQVQALRGLIFGGAI